MKVRILKRQLISVCVLGAMSVASFGSGCSKAKLNNPQNGNTSAIATTSDEKKKVDPLAKPNAGFAVTSGGGVFRGTGMTVIATLGEPVTVPSSVPEQVGSQQKVVPGLKGPLLKH